jgi:glycosyltransferase involved in cell wall biosynthesis
VHDIAFVHTPDRFSKHGVRVMRRGLERCRDADLVLCPSRSTADDLSTLGFDGARLRVIPWGVEAVPVGADDIDRVRRALDLPAEFVLFVGTIEPRKNLARLARAVDSLGVPLVVAGAAGWGDVDVAVDGVRFLGFVPDADLRPLMATADAFAYPSLEEGFGLPILEAMAQGTPVVTSRGSATEEVAGGAAVLVDPLDVEAIADGIRLALDDRGRWAQAACDRAATATWQATVDATIAAYREVAG